MSTIYKKKRVRTFIIKCTEEENGEVFVNLSEQLNKPWSEGLFSNYIDGKWHIFISCIKQAIGYERASEHEQALPVCSSHNFNI